MARVRYAVGDWFIVPLRDAGMAIGVVARANRGGVLLGYFFGPRRMSVPALTELETLQASEAILIHRFGHLGLASGSWQRLGRQGAWNPNDWPMPSFGRYEELTGRAYRVRYADGDPSDWISDEEIEAKELGSLPDASMAGAGWIELRLTDLLGPSNSSVS